MTTDGDKLHHPADLQGQQSDLRSSCGVHCKTEMSGTVRDDQSPPSAVVDCTGDRSNDGKNSSTSSKTEDGASAAAAEAASAVKPSPETEFEQEQVKLRQMERGEERGRCFAPLPAGKLQSVSRLMFSMSINKIGADASSR
jgi:hypothetical protein